MSIRTAIEINHDFHHNQKDTPEDFLRLLMHALYHGCPEDWETLRARYGIHLVYRCHHSDDRLAIHQAQKNPRL